MSRRGVTYTLVSIILLLVVGGLFFAQQRRTGHDAHVVVEERVRTMDNFIDDLEQDSRRAAYIAGFRALIGMEQQVTSSGEFFADADAAFRELFVTGNYSGRSFTVLENSSFSEYIDRAQYEAAKQGIDFDVNVTNVTLWHEDPWHVLVNYTLHVELGDRKGIANWSMDRTWTGRIPIQDIRDPVFAVHTLGRVQRVIKRTNVTGFVDDANDANDTTGLMTHFNNSLYVARGRGPDIIMRFEGNLSDSEWGIESLVDIEDLSDQGLAVNTTKSVVDYKYFQALDADACDIQNVPSKVKFATSDLDVYEVEGKLEYGAC